MLAWLVLLQTSLTIAVAGPATSPEYLPLRIAESAGYFADEKLGVSLRPVRADALAAQALARGQVDLAATSIDAALAIGHVGSAPPRVVFGLTAAPPVVLVVPAAKKDAIRQVADLRGKTVGIEAPGTPGQLALMSLLLRAQLRIDEVLIVSHGERGLVGAVEAAAVDAAMVADPWATDLVQAGKAAVLADLRDRDEAARQLGEPTVHAALFARPDRAPGRAELVALSRALLRAVARAQSATPAELSPGLARDVIGSPEAFALRATGARRSFLPDGRVSEARLRDTIALIRARSALPAKVHVPRNLDTLLLMEPLEQALR